MLQNIKCKLGFHNRLVYGILLEEWADWNCENVDKEYNRYFEKWQCDNCLVKGITEIDRERFYFLKNDRKYTRPVKRDDATLEFRR